ncbi:hypothetical protein GGR25_004580 [Kaistia hirudinis]|uniref:DUF2798 domain-containing protein n=1 Tax=Kaistia hirudinis TaxID=1293440 RepID=A0A840AWP0_9HYPH|nr:DUF2798 domain-containing protein [Kaistia hirudinis]MBB3933507.1 hypothetical protein [Kaistia hirudinis]MBN9020266.1 DUF2798 domain-containing protein [Hyphomicrobiales bacterium]
MTYPSSSLGRRKLPARFHAIVFPFILSIFMCGTVSAVSTAKGIGLTPDFVARWCSAWVISWLIAFPVLLLILPMVRRIVGWLVHAPSR